MTSSSMMCSTISLFELLVVGNPSVISSFNMCPIRIRIFHIMLDGLLFIQYQIKFIVDGNWRTDSRREIVTSGNITNNVLRVDQ